MLHSLQRDADGKLRRTTSASALDGIAHRLQSILAKHGPRSVAIYNGTFSNFCPAGVMLRDAFMDAIGSPMRFSNATIDQPGKPIAMARANLLAQKISEGSTERLSLMPCHEW